MVDLGREPDDTAADGAPSSPATADAVSFRLLGPVQASVGAEPLDLGPAKQRCLLALLLLEPNRLVRVERLIDLLWGEHPHDGARNTTHVYVSRLRRILAGRPDVRLVTSGPGYRLEVDSDHVDLHRFRRLVTDAHTADDERAAGLLRRAVGLWRGDPLDDVAPHHLRTTLCATLSEERVGAWEELVDIELRLGRHARIVGEVRDMAGRYPLRERIAEQYMTALYRGGRRADALAHYRNLREGLATELGLDPSPEPDRLHQRILRDDPDLAAPPVPPASAGRAPVPRQLPVDTTHFTGREAELDHLLARRVDRERPPPAVVISAIDGMAGIGKTALAVHVAHRLAEHYPDGQIFVNLHGFTEGVAPTDAGAALETLLRSVGVDGGQIPAALDERAALWRTRLAGRQALVVLDNARDETQVTPLLPGSPGCLVLVTSRRRLSGLDGAEPVSLDALTPAEAVDLFTATAGAGRLAGTGDDVIEEVTELCGRLPLAIRIAATRLRHHPTWTPDHLLGLLRGEHGPLAALRAGQRSVTAALNVSHQHLDDDQRRLYRVLGLHPGSDIDPYAASALLHTAVEVTQRLLDDLHHAHLLTEPAPGRYRFHDLVRAHAATLAGQSIEPDRRAVLNRLFDHYAHTAAVAMDLAYPHETDRRPHIAAPDTPTPDLDSPRAGEAWLDAELGNLLATATIATDHGRPDHLLYLSATLRRHLRARTHRIRALALHSQALTVARATGNHGGEQVALYSLASVHLAQGQHGQVVTCCRQVLEIARATGNRAGEVDALNGLGDLHCLQGQYEQATDRYQRALEIARAIGTRISEENALYGLGRVHHLQGRYERATDCYQQVLEIARAIGTRIGEHAALYGLGAVHLVQGQHERAADRYRQALDIATEIGNRNGQFEAHHGLARCHHATGRPCDALTSFRTALDLAVALSQPADQARSHDGLARTHLLLGRRDDARRHWETARDILASREIDRTDDPQVTVAAIRASLADLDAAPAKGP